MEASPLTEEVLNRAISKELQAARFYTEVSEKVLNKAGRRRMAGLSKEERRHAHLLAGRFKRLTGNPFNMDKSDGEQPEFKFESADKNWLNSASSLEIVSFAIGIEDKSIQFYSELLNEVSEKPDQKLLGSLVKFEEGHKRLLQSEYEALNRSNYWSS